VVQRQLRSSALGAYDTDYDGDHAREGDPEIDHPPLQNRKTRALLLRPKSRLRTAKRVGNVSPRSA
jgi:hypothetical protein